MKWENDVASSGPSAGGILGDRARQRPSRRRLYFVPFHFRNAVLTHSLKLSAFLYLRQCQQVYKANKNKITFGMEQILNSFQVNTDNFFLDPVRIQHLHDTHFHPDFQRRSPR